MTGQAMSLRILNTNVVGRAPHHASAKDRLAAAFQRAVAFSRSPVKELARKLNRTPNGAALLLRGDVSPNLETIITACREFDDVWEEFRDLCGRADDANEAERILADFAQKLKERRHG